MDLWCSCLARVPHMCCQPVPSTRIDHVPWSLYMICRPCIQQRTIQTTVSLRQNLVCKYWVSAYGKPFPTTQKQRYKLSSVCGARSDVLRHSDATLDVL